MDFIYRIEGVRCRSCLDKIKIVLQPITNSIELSLNPPILKLTSIQKVTFDDLNARVRIAGNYRLLSSTEDDIQALASSAKEEKNRGWLNIYYPFLLIIAYLFSISLANNFSFERINWHLWMGNFMAGFFLVFSAFKFLDLPGFAKAYANYDLLAERWIGYGYVYPFLELGLGFAYLIQFVPTATYIITIILMAFSSIGVMKALLKKRKINCACLGTVLNFPMSNITLIEDFSMIIMAIMMLTIG